VSKIPLTIAFVIVCKEASKFGEINVRKVRFTTFLYVIHLVFTLHYLNTHCRLVCSFSYMPLFLNVFHALSNTHEAGKFCIHWR